MAETLHFSTHGQHNPDSIPLVLLHGWGLNSGVWQLFIEQWPTELAGKFHIVTIDLPGFGDNYAVDIHPYTIKNIVKEMAQVIEQPAIFLGWSLGGLIATDMALTFPEKTLGLITVASSPYFLAEVTENHQSQDDWPGIKPIVLTAFHNQIQVDTQKTINNFLKIQAMGSPHIRQDIKQLSQLVMQYQMPTKNTLDESLSLLETSDYRKAISDVKPPFLRLYGSADGLVPKAVIKQVNDLATQSEHVVIEQASHAPFISHLSDFNHVLSQWLLKHFDR